MDNKLAYGTPANLTITLTSLASSATAGRESDAISNASDKFADVHVYVKVKTQNSGTIGNDSAVYVYAYGSSDEGTPQYPDTVTGADAGITLNSPTQLKLIGKLFISAINTTYKSDALPLAWAFGGALPKRWGIVLRNYCGTALSSSGSDHRVHYQGIYSTLA
jgi:hypothetical protein